MATRRKLTVIEARQLAAGLVVRLIRHGKERLPEVIQEEDRGAVSAALGEIEEEMLRRVIA